MTPGVAREWREDRQSSKRDSAAGHRSDRRRFTHEVAGNLGTMLPNGHIGTIERSVLACRSPSAEIALRRVLWKVSSLSSSLAEWVDAAETPLRP
jgi:hypothetical protein